MPTSINRASTARPGLRPNRGSTYDHDSELGPRGIPSLLRTCISTGSNTTGGTACIGQQQLSGGTWRIYMVSVTSKIWAIIDVLVGYSAVSAKMSEWASTTWPGLVPNRGSTCFGVLLPSHCSWVAFCPQNGVRYCIRLFPFLYDQGTAFESICYSYPRHVVIT